MLSDRLDDLLRRTILLRLARIAVQAVRPEDGRFDHRFLSAFASASWLVCTMRLARRTLEAMPQRVIDVMAEDAQAGRPGQRLADYLSQGWRPEGWLTPSERRVARTYMTNPLTRAVAKEMMRLRARAN